MTRGHRSSSVGRDEVDELLDAADQGRLEVGPGAHAGEDPLRPDVAGVVLPAQPPCRRRPSRARPFGTIGQAVMPTTDGLTACQMSMNGWPTTSAWSPVTCSAMRDSLEPRHQVVDEHAEPPSGRRAELAHDRRQVVDAVQRLDDDALDPQVVAPDLLHQLGVVLALDVDAALAGDPRAGAGDVGRAGGAARRAGGRRAASAAPGRRAVRRPRSRGRAGSRGRVPKRSSRWTTSFSQRTTAPTNPVLGSSTTRSVLGLDLRDRLLRRCAGGRGCRTASGEAPPDAKHGTGRIRDDAPRHDRDTPGRRCTSSRPLTQVTRAGRGPRPVVRYRVPAVTCADAVVAASWTRRGRPVSPGSARASPDGRIRFVPPIAGHPSE